VPHCSLTEAIVDFLDTEYGIEISENSFELERLPDHLLMHYEILGPNEKVLAIGRDLGALQEQLAVAVQARFADIKREVRFEKSRLHRWSIGDLPETVELDRHTVGYPGLCTGTDNGEVALRLWPGPDCAASQHRLGVAALYQVEEANRVDDLEKALFAGATNRSASQTTPKPAQKQQPKSAADNFGTLAGAFGDLKAPASPVNEQAAPSTPPKKTEGRQMLNQSQLLLLGQLGSEPRRNRSDLVSRVLIEHLGQPRTQAEWTSATDTSLSDMLETALRFCDTLGRILTTAETINRLLDRNADNAAYESSLDDGREHFEQLLRPGWLLDGEFSAKLNHFRGLEARLTRVLGSPPAKDLAKLDRYHKDSHELWQTDTSCECGECVTTVAFQEQLETDNDLRLTHFAQELRRR
jgi:hypothetical protein